MFKKVLLLLLLLFLLTSTTFAQEGVLYENKDYKFRLMYPQNWQPLIYNKSSINAVVVACISPDDNASVSVQVSKSTRKKVEYLSAEEVRQVVEETFNDARRSTPNIKLISYSIEPFKNKKTITIYTTCPSSLSAHESVDTVYVMFNGPFKYEICYGGFIPEMEQYRNILIESINTFEFIL